MTTLEAQGAAAKKAAESLAIASTEKKNEALLAIAEEIDKNREVWIKANSVDIINAKTNDMSPALLDRLTLTNERIDGIIQGIKEVVALPDPVGRILSETERPNGLKIVKKSVPIGVIAIIYEARPNVTVDAAALTLKSGNAVILKGGKEAANSNDRVMDFIHDALERVGLDPNCISLVKSPSRETTVELMNLTEYVDLLIPRGGRGLIRSVVENAKVPVIRTGEGVCHIYIDKDADLEMGAKILNNAKTSRPSVCNAAECVLIHEDVIKDFFKVALPLLKEHDVKLVCDITALKYTIGRIAKDEDWDTEYGDYVLAVKTVSGVDEAIEFIGKHGTGHSEAIVTNNADTAAEFLNRVDAAAVYVNASTRFTDGGEFGLGAEIGISTQKMHARGPMGLEELTSYKYVVYGNGQIR